MQRAMQRVLGPLIDFAFAAGLQGFSDAKKEHRVETIRDWQHPRRDEIPLIFSSRMNDWNRFKSPPCYDCTT
jgi:hypothetical protein